MRHYLAPSSQFSDIDRWFEMPKWMTKESMAFNPQIDITENEKNYMIFADIPGVDPENISITLEDDNLVISGSRQHETETKGSDSQLSHFERSYGEFRRSFNLPKNIDSDSIEADCRNGVLEITIPKTKEKKNSRKIQLGQNNKKPTH